MSAIQQPATSKPGQSGFTLIELMVVLAIVSILLLVATPNYDSVIIGSKIDKARYSLASSLAFARTEAVKRGDTVSMSSISGTSDWTTGGWQVADSGGTVLRVVDSDNDGVDITHDCGATVSFGSIGERTSSAATPDCRFDFSDSGGNSSFDESLWINVVGRVRMK